MDGLLLSALPSQLAAQLSAVGAGRAVDGGGDCGVEFGEDPKFGGVPR
jgi:hypothetical protein